MNGHKNVERKDLKPSQLRDESHSGHFFRVCGHKHYKNLQGGKEKRGGKKREKEGKREKELQMWES